MISETGDRHQKFASKKKIPLSGGIYIFLIFLPFYNENLLSVYVFLILILLVGLFSDLKFIKSALLRFILQIFIVLFCIINNDYELQNTKIFILDKLLLNEIFNYIFVTFCILIVINGSNFLDGLNTLNIGYYSIIFLFIFLLNKDPSFEIEKIQFEYFIIAFLIIFILNFLNKIYLGDSGSYLLGFIFSLFLIKIYMWNQNISPFFIILLLWYPSFETLFSIT